MWRVIGEKIEKVEGIRWSVRYLPHQNEQFGSLSQQFEAIEREDKIKIRTVDLLVAPDVPIKNW